MTMQIKTYSEVKLGNQQLTDVHTSRLATPSKPEHFNSALVASQKIAQYQFFTRLGLEPERSLSVIVEELGNDKTA